MPGAKNLHENRGLVQKPFRLIKVLYLVDSHSDFSNSSRKVFQLQFDMTIRKLPTQNFFGAYADICIWRITVDEQQHSNHILYRMFCGDRTIY